MKSLAVSWALALSLVFAGQRAHAAACPAACATCDGDTCLTCTGAALLVDGKVSRCLPACLARTMCTRPNWPRPQQTAPPFLIPTAQHPHPPSPSFLRAVLRPRGVPG